jgi:hypothetical protein
VVGANEIAVCFVTTHRDKEIGGSNAATRGYDQLQRMLKRRAKVHEEIEGKAAVKTRQGCHSLTFPGELPARNIAFHPLRSARLISDVIVRLSVAVTDTSRGTVHEQGFPDPRSRSHRSLQAAVPGKGEG